MYYVYIYDDMARTDAIEIIATGLTKSDAEQMVEVLNENLKYDRAADYDIQDGIMSTPKKFADSERFTVFIEADIDEEPSILGICMRCIGEFVKAAENRAFDVGQVQAVVVGLDHLRPHVRVREIVVVLQRLAVHEVLQHTAVDLLRGVLE